MKTTSKLNFKAAILTATRAAFWILAVTATGAFAQTPTNTQLAVPVVRVIVISLEDRRLALIEDGQLKKVYTVAVGKPSTPSPVGSFAIVSHVANPTYSHKGVVAQPGPNNPVGTRWMGLNIQGYGIHGTNAPSSIGKAASHGCIRMGRADLEEFFRLVHAGDAVEIIGERNEQTTQLFGAPALPKSPAVTQTAQARQIVVAPVFVTMPDSDAVSLTAFSSAPPVVAPPIATAR